MMYKIFIVAVLSFILQQKTNTISPDRKFKIAIESKEEGDSQISYIINLIDIVSKKTTELARCTRKDLPSPNFYWDKDSEYLIYEYGLESFNSTKIRVLNLKTKRNDFELNGLIGNEDNSKQQFDSKNHILIYFDTSIEGKSHMPDLCIFDIKSKIKKKVYEFVGEFDFEFPEIKRVEGKREIKITYSDIITGESFIKQIKY